MEIILEREEKSVIWGRGGSNGRTGSDLGKKLSHVSKTGRQMRIGELRESSPV